MEVAGALITSGLGAMGGMGGAVLLVPALVDSSSDWSTTAWA